MKNSNNNNRKTLHKLDASQYCWNSIWKAEETHLKLPILDVIRLLSSSEGNNIIGWLFTATDGNVKSKSKNRWNEPSVLERCSAYNQKIGAHITHDGIKWYNGNDSILHNSFALSSNTKVIISFNHLSIQTPFFIEHSYNKADPLPKMSTSIFVDSKAKGKFNDNDKDMDYGIFPPYRILNLNKNINSIANFFVSDLVKAIESRERVKVIKLVTVLLYEADDRIERDTKIWLHHVDEIIYEEINTNNMNNDNDKASSIYASTKASYRESFNNSDMKSVTYSEVSYGQASFHRLHKCQGDFCQYNEEEEYQQITLEGYDGANVLEASKKARLQFRKVTGGDTSKLKETLDDPSAFSSPDKVDLAEREEGLDGITIGGGKERKDEHDESMPLALKKTSQSRFVPYKSIALARQDMADLESAQETSFVHSPVPWTELLYHWYWRAGRSIVQRKGSVPVPISAGHKIGVAMISNRFSNIMKKDDSHIGNSHKNTFNNDDSNILTSKDDSMPQGLARKPLFKNDDDTIINDVDPQKVGQFSWYYSDARVCEHCYKVYKDLDRRRGDKQTTLLKAQKKALEVDEVERGKEIEKRMFNQRKQASRLAKPVAKKISSEPSMSSNIYAEPSAITDPFGDHSISQMQHNQSRKQMVGVPKGFLPPLPWNLTNPEQRESYQNSGSTFAKSLKSKTDQLKELNKHEQKMKELQHMRKKMLGGMLDEESAILEDPSGVILERDELEEWYKATGRYKDPNAIEVIQRPIKSNKKEAKTVDPRTFDAGRLLHPWQRDFNKMREQHNKKQNKKTQKKSKPRNDDDEYDYEDDNQNERKEQQQYQPSATMKTLQKFEQLKAKAKGSKGKMTRSNSLPPMASSAMQMSQITLDSNIKSTMGSSISSTILNDNNYKGFKGLARHTNSYEESGTGTNNKSLKQLQNFEKSLSRTSVNDNSDDVGVRKPLSQSSKRVIFDESSLVQTNESPVKNINYTRHYNDDDEDDDNEDDDDDDDEGIGWSPFVVSGL